MRIIQLITRIQRRGAEIFASQLAQKLLEGGHEVMVISIYGGEAKLPFDGKLETLNANPTLQGVDFKAWKKLDALIREFQADIIQANASETLKFAAISKKFFGWKPALVYRNANIISGFLGNKAKLLFNRWLMAEVDAVVSVSDATLKDFNQMFTVKHQRAIPIGVDPKDCTEALQQVDSCPISGEYLIFIGGLVPEKDPLGMLEIFKELQIPSLKMVFLGSGPLETSLTNKIQKLGLTDQVLLIPNQANIFPYLSNASALVISSKVEGLPGVILEAMYCKVPVIAYGVGGIPEVVKNGKTGWCITPSDSKAFIHSIHEVLTKEAFAKQKNLNQAHHLVLSHYTLPQVTRQFEDFYKDLLARY